MNAPENPAGDWVGEWQVVSVGADAAPDRVVARLTLTSDGTVAGHGGVNSFSGSYAVVGEQIEIGPLMATLIGGPEPAAQFEAALLAGLCGRREWRIAGDELVIGRGESEIRCRSLAPRRR